MILLETDDQRLAHDCPQSWKQNFSEQHVTDL
jgi:hypothetical protein